MEGHKRTNINYSYELRGGLQHVDSQKENWIWLGSGDMVEVPWNSGCTITFHMTCGTKIGSGIGMDQVMQWKVRVKTPSNHIPYTFFYMQEKPIKPFFLKNFHGTTHLPTWYGTETETRNKTGNQLENGN